MAPPLLKCSEIALTFGGTPLLTGADMQVHGGDRICLVGRNGSGKSTFLKIAAGLVEPDDGERFLQPGIHAAYLQQEPDFGDAETANDYASSGFAEFEDPYPARAMLEELGLDPEARLATLSGGEARRAALVRALAPQPDILMLDEPTNHLDLPTIAWLERTLAAARAALILISHDRRFLEALSQTTVWLDRGKTRRLDKGFDAFEAWRDNVLEQEALDAHKRDRAIAREEDWMQGGVSGRRKRNMRRVAELHALRKERQTAQASVGTVKLEASDAQASGKLVCEAAGITHSYDGGAPIIRDVSLRIMRGDRLGLVGPNGAGKTTLLKILIGELQPSAGTIRHGANLETVWLDQKRDALDDHASLTDVLTGGRGDSVMVNGRQKHVASYLKEFLFLPEQARSPVKVLSGGERARLMLAKSLSQASNLLVLDEPTNDLDLETLDLLQELLSDYAGTLLLVSHDRDFLDRVCTSVLAFEGNGRWVEYAGGFTDMMHQGGGAFMRPSHAHDGGPSSQIKPKLTRTPDAKQATTQRKLSYKEKHALETLPSRMEELAARKSELETELADPALYQRNPDRFSAASDALDQTQQALDAAEEQWLELEMKREALEA